MSRRSTAAALAVDYEPVVWPGAKPDKMRMAADGLPARVVKAHNAHKAHYINEYASTVAVAMQNKWPYRAFIDTYAGPGICWVEDTGEFVKGSPLIVAEAKPAFTHHILVDKDEVCARALTKRIGATGAKIICDDSNAYRVIDAVRAEIPSRGCLSLALLDPQGCSLKLETIRRLTEDRPMDLLINLPIHSLFRCLGAGYWQALDAVLGPDWPKLALHGVPGWRAAVRAHYREKLGEMGYGYTAAKEVRGEKRNGRLYDFILASKHPLAKRLFEEVTKETAHGQLSLI
jgi:three-Cys-motif partner protein